MPGCNGDKDAMNTFTQSALFFAVAALTPLAVQANMAELSDADLRAVQGQATLGPGFQAYRAEMGSMWSDLTTVQGKSAALHYAGWGSVMTGYTIIASTGAAAVAVNKAPFPVNQLDALTVPVWYAGAGIGLTGAFLLHLNGE